MEKYYLEFLDELCVFLEKDNCDVWNKWMQKAKTIYENNRDLNYFFSSFGGMGSFNDYYCEDDNIKCIICVLRSVTYNIATEINNNGNSGIMDILSKERDRYLNNFSKGYKNDDMLKNFEYLNYILNNYKDLNLHDIDMQFINQHKVNDNNVMKK